MFARFIHNRYFKIAAVVAIAALAIWAIAGRGNRNERLLADLNSDDMAVRLIARRSLGSKDRATMLNRLCAETEHRRVDQFVNRYFEMRPGGTDYAYYRTPPDGDTALASPPGTYLPAREELVQGHAARMRELADTVQSSIIRDWLDAQGRTDLQILLNQIALDVNDLEGLARYDDPLPPPPAPPQAVNSFAPAVGTKRFVAILKSRDMIDESPDDLYADGQAMMKSIQREMKKVAESIRPGVPVHDVLRDISMDYPPADQMIDVADKECRKALAFVRKERIAPIPAGADKTIIEDEASPNGIAYYSAYIRATQPWESTYVGRYIINSGLGLPPEELAAHSRANNRCSTMLQCVHETFPGHQLQQAYEWKYPRSPLRKMAACQSYFEGWAMYAEQVMYEHGYFDTPDARLVYLQHRLWRAARIVIGVGYHTQRISGEEGLRLLTDVVGLDAGGARIEMQRYAADPTVALCYMIGCREITKLRDEYKTKMGKDYSESEFHRRFLEIGSMPIPLARDIILSDG